ncbi:hypothetical protein [Oligoflexus tunisiensis]|uniref:hypothetical protein n=1 Tax=Oligoflexus tunisiensis TaxID=708132 RepID=UPI00114CF9EC|nr:hypothetical protein [Oligoflexus tunisiensis]
MALLTACSQRVASYKAIVELEAQPRDNQAATPEFYEYYLESDYPSGLVLVADKKIKAQARQKILQVANEKEFRILKEETSFRVDYYLINPPTLKSEFKLTSKPDVAGQALTKADVVNSIEEHKKNTESVNMLFKSPLNITAFADGHTSLGYDQERPPVPGVHVSSRGFGVSKTLWRINDYYTYNDVRLSLAHFVGKNFVRETTTLDFCIGGTYAYGCASALGASRTSQLFYTEKVTREGLFIIGGNELAAELGVVYSRVTFLWRGDAFKEKKYQWNRSSFGLSYALQ